MRSPNTGKLEDKTYTNTAKQLLGSHTLGSICARGKRREGDEKGKKLYRRKGLEDRNERG